VKIQEWSCSYGYDGGDGGAFRNGTKNTDMKVRIKGWFNTCGYEARIQE
jgi:hypothetical protein